MKVAPINSIESTRLLLIFAGWGMDATPFAGLGPGYSFDIAVAYDYTDGIGMSGDLSSYDEVMILAWSFGVIAADHFIAAHPELPITSRIAVNGTLHPVDDSLGIPRATFNATLQGLSEASLLKFYRRMCGDAGAFKAWEEVRPQRTIDSLRDELTAIAAMSGGTARWDKAIISTADRIIPPANQFAAWQQTGTYISEVDGPHLPDFRAIMASALIDKHLVATRFEGAARSYESNAPVQLAMATELSRLWQRHCHERELNKVIEIGAGTGAFTRAYMRWLSVTGLELWDLAHLPDSLPGLHRVCDAEARLHAVATASLQAIVSSATIQWFSSIPSFIAQCNRTLKPGGWLVLSTFGPDNFYQLRRAGYLSPSQWRQMLDEAGFDTREIDERRTTLDFSSPRKLLEHIRLTGVNAIASGPASARQARRIIASGTTSLTYHPLLIVARKP